jgi:guanine deaminase
MNCSQMCSKARAGRLIVGLIVSACLIVGVMWFLQASSPKTAMAFIPVPKDQGATAAVPSDKPRITSAEIMGRFPTDKHEEFMRRAIANSRKGGVEYKTGGAFGAVIVDKDGEVLADGVNHVVAQSDPTWHGEMHAIRQACALLKKPKLDGCILYTSAEPCPMCLATAYWAGLDGIVYGATVGDSKKYGNFDDAFIYEQLTKPVEDRAISEQTMLRPEAVEVWKEYAARQDKIDY